MHRHKAEHLCLFKDTQWLTVAVVVLGGRGWARTARTASAPLILSLGRIDKDHFKLLRFICTPIFLFTAVSVNSELRRMESGD